MATANQHLSALRGVLKECWRLGSITAQDYHRAADVQTVRGSVLPRGRALRQGELRAVFGACQDDPTPLAIRDGAILAVLYGAGVRRVPRPQYPNSHGVALVEARRAIEHGDRHAALDLLAAVARGDVPADNLEAGVSEALVATARAEQEERDCAALARYQQTQAAAEQVLQLLRTTPWDRADLTRLRAVLDELDGELRRQEPEHARTERMDGANQSRRRLGRGSLEAKLIRGYGPYLYYRFRAGGRHRSVYVGKAGPSS